MTHAPPAPGTSPTRRRVATLVAVVGLAVVGGQLARVWPRDVEVTYQPGPRALRVDVDILEDGEAVVVARFNRPGDAGGDWSTFAHTVSLPPGEYAVHITVYGPSGTGIEHSRLLIVPADGLIRFDLRD